MTNDNDTTFQDLSCAYREIDRLKAENARLVAALAKAPHDPWCPIETCPPFPAGCNCYKSKTHSSALRDLLEPVVNTLDRIDRYQAGAGMIPSRKEVNDLIARLRAAMGDEKE